MSFSKNKIQSVLLEFSSLIHQFIDKEIGSHPHAGGNIATTEVGLRDVSQPMLWQIILIFRQ